MTIAQQKDYVRRLVEGWTAAKADQIETARQRTPAERWVAADRLMKGAQVFDEKRTLRRASSGLIEQQRLFAKLRPA